MLLGSDTITIINDGPVTGHDGMGVAIYTKVLIGVTGCSVQERQTKRELTNITDVEYARFRIFAPIGTPLTGTSLVVIGVLAAWPPPATTLVWQVDGEPTLWHSRHGAPHHIECYLREQIG
jgi:hypothetical protein